MKTLRSFLNTFQAINFVSSGQCSDEEYAGSNSNFVSFERGMIYYN